MPDASFSVLGEYTRKRDTSECPKTGGASLIEAIIAGAVSLVVGVASTRYSDYAYWRGWAPIGFALGMVGLAAIYTAAGIVGFLTFDRGLDVPRGVAAAVVEGMAGHAALRAQLNRLGVDADNEYLSAFRLLNGWVIEFLEVRAHSGIDKWIADLRDARLIDVAFELFWRHLNAPTDEIRALIHSNLRSAADDLDGDATAKADGRGRLRGFCRDEIATRRIVWRRA